MLSNADHQEVQVMIETATPDLRKHFKADAEHALTQANILIAQKILSRDEKKSLEIAVEILVRLEALESNKGWLFRAKRRVQLLQMYLGA